MKRIIYMIAILASLHLISCDNDEPLVEPGIETVTEEGVVYRIFRLEVGDSFVKYLKSFDPADVMIWKQEKEDTTGIRIMRDPERLKTLIIKIPESLNLEDGIYRSRNARQGDWVFTFPIEMAVTNNVVSSCQMSSIAFGYEDMLRYDENKPAPGSISNPFLIGDFQELKDFRACIEDDDEAGKGRYFLQDGDIPIDMRNMSTGEVGWTPIGHLKAKRMGFNGHYDGGGHSLKNFYTNNIDPNNQGINYLGIFSILLPESSVKNLTIENYTIDCPNCSYIGTLAGRADTGVVLENIKIINSIIKGKDYLGGLVGEFNGSSIKKCVTERAEIEGGSGLGLLIGAINAAGYASIRMYPTITDSYNEGMSRLTGSNKLGGIIGCANGVNMTISNAKNAAYKIEASGDFAGGLIGYVTGRLTMKDCSNELNVGSNQTDKKSLNANAHMGGLIGSLNSMDGLSTISNCESSASIKATGGYVGGLLGSLGGSLKMTNPLCGIEGLIELGGNYAGGLIGHADGDVTITASADKSVNNTSLIVNGDYVGGLIGCATRTVTLQNVMSKGAVTGNKFVGGLIGSGKNITLKDTRMSGVATVMGTENVGGLVGYISSGTLTMENQKQLVVFEGFVNAESNLSAPNCGGVLGYGIASTVELNNLEMRGKINGGENVGGLIGQIEKGRKTHVGNCLVESTNGVHGVRNVGGLGGQIFSDYLTFGYCTNNAPVTASDNRAGGIVAYLTTDTGTETIANSCYNKGDVTAIGRVAGGIIGRIDHASTSNTFTVNYCENWGTVSAIADLGGIIGYIDKEQESNNLIFDQLHNHGVVSFAAGTPSDDSKTAGGIIGRSLARTTTIQYCSNRGEIKASKSLFAGGIIGRMGKQGSGTSSNYINNCFNIATIAGGKTVGGIVGKMENVHKKSYGIHRCYNTKKVTGGDNVGGIAGEIDNGNIVTHCYYFGAALGSKCYGIVDKGQDSRFEYNYVLEGTDTGFTNKKKAKNLTQSEFGVASNFTDWNFSNTWEMRNGRPQLRHNFE
ncbi:hypothetical protein M2134_002278 [Parabacteroides sp. PM6-13]|uniref:hypothetical protein n=1 Tax=Parabacteroides sp. PM6-13 TaxID=1742408 RepID=UPI0024743400|nr:hypothetical protein [Parabacteroides sp. PM6-13]MDH6343393.1 hypothetical protein [Parabacteroides sp. PM6-13]